MELKWWPVAVVGLLLLVVVAALAVWLPVRQARRNLRPLAHVDRLTRLPEYRQMVRLQFWSVVGVVVLLMILFAEALLASSRPLGVDKAGDAKQPEDVMLCVGQPVTDPGTAGLLNYFASHITKFDSQRIGLTSPSLRVVPLTRDYQYAGDSFLRYAKLAASQQDVDAGRAGPAQVDELRSRVDEFNRPLDYLDYARSAEDVLALCLAGFPGGDGHRRSVIYLGDGPLRAPDERRPSLFTAEQVTQMATSAGIQVNVVSGQPAAPLQSLAAATGGQYDVYDQAGADAEPALAAILDRIRATPPEAQGEPAVRPLTDYPNVPLITGLVVAALLCLSLAVLRR